MTHTVYQPDEFDHLKGATVAEVKLVRGTLQLTFELPSGVLVNDESHATYQVWSDEEGNNSGCFVLVGYRDEEAQI